MDEFRKPYEYEEDKISGSLLTFVILLLATDIFLTFSITFQSYAVFGPIPIARYAFLAVCALYLLFLLFTAVVCYKGKRCLIKVSKVFLITRALFTVACLTLNYVRLLNEPNIIGGGTNQFESVMELTLIIFVFPATYMLVFSAGWFLYFIKSKKCAELVKNAELSAQAKLQKVKTSA